MPTCACLLHFTDMHSFHSDARTYSPRNHVHLESTPHNDMCTALKKVNEESNIGWFYVTTLCFLLSGTTSQPTQPPSGDLVPHNCYPTPQTHAFRSFSKITFSSLFVGFLDEA
eukprot:42156_1